jgi:Cu-Zn family superoxide dismutase
MNIFFQKIYLTAVICLTAFPLLAAEKIEKAVAFIRPTKGNSVQGKVTFTLERKGMHVVADIEGLTPGKHGFHVHEFGDCNSDDGTSAGEHFNPTNKKHGGPDGSEHHVGDLGNIVADDQGYAHFDSFNKEIKFEGENNILGKSVVVHSNPDDYTSQPAGNSGPRLGCGIIEPVQRKF